MGTRARIGIFNADKTVTSIYTHWDGYPEHHGPILSESYATEEAVRLLVSFGDASSLEPRCIPSTLEHSYASPEEGVTVYYGRDRGEKDVGAITHPANAWPQCGQEFEYLFREGAWKFRCSGSKSWRKLPNRKAA